MIWFKILLANINKILNREAKNVEYYSFDDIGAEILYCISKNFSLDKIIEVIQEEYDVTYDDCKKAIVHFLEETPILHIIYANLIKSDIYLYLKPFREAL